MNRTSLDKSKIKVLLLEGVHPSGLAALQANGYTQVTAHAKSLPEDQLIAAASDAYILGIRSATQLTANVLQNAPKLMAIGCFCIGTNQVDLEAAQCRGIPVFNAPFSNTRSVAELVLAEAIFLQRGIPQRCAAAHRGATCNGRVCWMTRTELGCGITRFFERTQLTRRLRGLAVP